MNGESIVILTVGAIYLLGMLYAGYKASKQLHSLDDYILGGRNLPWYVLTLTFAATVANTATVMGQPGFAYSTGFTYVFWAALSSSTIGTVLLSRFGSRLRLMNLSTVGDLADARFGKSRRLEVLLSVIQVSWSIFLIGMSLFGVALILEVITGVSWAWTIGPIAVVTILYTMTGGLKAVVLTDAVQMVIILLGVSALFYMLSIKYGFFTGFITEYVGKSGFDLQTGAEGTTLFAGFTDLFTLPPEVTVFSLIAFILATSFWIPVDLGFIQRALAAKNFRESRKGVYSFFALDWLNAWLLVIIGAYGVVLLPGLVNTDEVVIRLVRETLPLFGAALVVTAVAAAAMSTISTYLNAGSGIIVKNIILKIKSDLSDQMQIRLTRMFTVIIGLTAIVFAPFISSNGIVIAAVGIQIILISALTPLVLLSLYWRKMTEKAAFWGCILTVAATLVMMIQVGGPYAAFGGEGYLGVPVIIWGIALAFTLYISISLMDASRGEEQMSPDCVNMFNNSKTASNNKDLVVLSVIWGGLILLGLYRHFSGKLFTFPFLSGFGGIVTNIVLSLIALLTSGFGIYIIIRVFKYVKEDFKHKKEI